jgi:hypothetical protein
MSPVPGMIRCLSRRMNGNHFPGIICHPIGGFDPGERFALMACFQNQKEMGSEYRFPSILE